MIETINATWSQLISFLKDPKDLRDETSDFAEKCQTLLALLLIDLGIMFVLMMFIGILEEINIIPELGDHAMSKMMDDYNMFEVFLMAVVAAPLSEEAIFRFMLTFKRNPIQFLIERETFNKYFKIYFYLIAALFAAIHLSNFEYSTALLFVAPLMVSPQFILGAMLGYVRVRFGFVWCVALHALHNGTLMVPFLLIGEPIEKLDVSNSQYDLKVIETMIPMGEESVTDFEKDTLSFENIELGHMIELLVETERDKLEFEPESESEKIISIDFIDKANLADPRQQILKELEDAYQFSFSKDGDKLKVVFEESEL